MLASQTQTAPTTASAASTGVPMCAWVKVTNTTSTIKTLFRIFQGEEDSREGEEIREEGEEEDIMEEKE